LELKKKNKLDFTPSDSWLMHKFNIVLTRLTRKKKNVFKGYFGKSLLWHFQDLKKYCFLHFLNSFDYFYSDSTIYEVQYLPSASVGQPFILYVRLKPDIL